MYKLIELLLNYEEEIKKTEWDYRYYWNMIDSLQLECRNVISSQILMREERWLILISKSFWFIKWLVDNDKIDLEKLDKKSERKPMYSFEEEWKIWFKLFGVYDSLLMLLAIQDNPIEFLCSVLK